MSTVAKRYTPEDLLTMPDASRYELVNGELVERDMSFESERIAFRVACLLQQFCDANPVGRVTGETFYQCFADEPTTVRRPGASFISFERMPATVLDPQGHCRVVPDLVVEVTSPNDYIDDVFEKVDEYLAAGVRLVWIVIPRTREVHVRGAGRANEFVGSDGELTGGDVLPGFRCPVSTLFPSPRPA